MPRHTISYFGARDTGEGEAAVASIGAPRNISSIHIDMTSDDSIEHCYKTVEQLFGRLDALFNNAGDGDGDLRLRSDKAQISSLRKLYQHSLNVNVAGAGVLTEKMLQIHDKSNSPKVIFISSVLGSITDILSDGICGLVSWYESGMAGLNML